MAEKDFIQLYNEFRSLAAAGDEAAARQFLLQHRAEFPEEVQDRIALLLLEQGVSEAAEEAASERAAQEEVAGGIQTLERNRRALEDKLKALDLTERLK